MMKHKIIKIKRAVDLMANATLIIATLIGAIASIYNTVANKDRK